MPENQDAPVKVSEEELERDQKTEEIEKLKSEVEEAKNKYLRLLAETENTRKRMQKEKQESIRFTIENTIGEFLPALDSFENGLKFAENTSKEIKNWASGFSMILSQFKEVLHNHGIVAFHSEGNMFDPMYHEAVEILETDENAEGTILKEFTRGYKSASRTIRPARVKVSKIPRKEPEPQKEEELPKEDKKEQ